MVAKSPWYRIRIFSGHEKMSIKSTPADLKYHPMLWFDPISKRDSKLTTSTLASH